MIYKLQWLPKNKLIGQCVLSEKKDRLNFYLNENGQLLWELIKNQIININKRGNFRVVISEEKFEVKRLTPWFFQALRQELFTSLELAVIS